MTEQRKPVNRFSYSPKALRELEVTLSPERLETYLRAVPNRDKVQAVRLYLWNVALSSAFYEVLQGLEVTLRNAIHNKLVSCYGCAWFEEVRAGLDNGGARRIKRLKEQLAQSGTRHVTPDRMVAGLSFGFWVSLLGPGGRIGESNRKANYEMTLWRPALRGAFPHKGSLTRKQAHAALDRLRVFRNRIAHYEPILGRNHLRDYRLILEVTGWMSPTMSEWLEIHSRIPGLLEPPRNSNEIRLYPA